MSVIAVKITEKEITISADQQSTWGDNKETAPECKLFQKNGVVIGHTGFSVEGDLLKIFCLNHKPKSADIDAVLEFLSEFQDWWKKKDSGAEVKGHNIIVFENKVFRTIRFGVEEVKEFSAVGSGMFSALAALELGQSTEKAVDIAKKFDLYCGGETETIIIPRL